MAKEYMNLKALKTFAQIGIFGLKIVIPSGNPAFYGMGWGRNS
jgi:hypothetical protein